MAARDAVLFVVAAAASAAGLLLACSTGSDITPPSVPPDASLANDAALAADARIADDGSWLVDANASDASLVVPKGARMLGLDVVDVAEGGTFDDNTAFAKSVGASVLPIHLTWSGIEPDSPGDCATAGSYHDDVLTTFDTYATAHGLALSVTIGVVDTAALVVPARFSPTAFDGDAGTTNLMICRFDAMIDFVFSKLHAAKILSLQIGNELDAYAPSSVSTTFWSSYYAFFAGALTHVHAVRPGLPVGFTATWAGLTGNGTNPLAKGAYASLVPTEDIVGFTYYGIHDDFTVKPPAQVGADFDQLVSLFPTKTFFVQEAGYPSDATYDLSSGAAQAAFVGATFDAWDKHASNMPYLDFVRLVDYSHAAAESFAEDAGAPFVSYLETLGFRTYQGVDKPSIAALKSETHARGFW